MYFHLSRKMSGVGSPTASASGSVNGSPRNTCTRASSTKNENKDDKAPLAPCKKDDDDDIEVNDVEVDWGLSFVFLFGHKRTMFYFLLCLMFFVVPRLRAS